MRIDEFFKRIFADKKKLFLLVSIFAILSFTYSQLIKKILILLGFIAAAGISKIYHRFFKSTIGVDLVFFTTALTALAYKNLFLSLFVGWAGLILADSLGTKFTHYSLVTLIGLSATSFLAQAIIFLPFTYAFIVLMIAFEIITAIFYYIMGSPPDKILVFVLSHLIFNSILLFSFADYLIKAMA